MPEQLTDAELNERVMRCLGRIPSPDPITFRWRPNYTGSLDACREVIAEVEQRGLWSRFCGELYETADDGKGYSKNLGIRDRGARTGLLATPRQICEAFLAALEGK